MRFIVTGLVLGVLVFSFGPFSFTHAALEQPLSEYPLTQDPPVWKGQVEFKWKSTGAPFYKHSIDLPNGEQKTVVTSSAYYRTSDLELGEDYRWRISSCNDRDGTDCGQPSATQVFSIVPAPPGVTGGLIPCGRQYDDALTTINESEPCGFSHIFLLLKNVLDFVLWRLGLLIIALMALATAAVTYFSFGSPNIILWVKSTWRSVIVGYLIALFAWLIVNVILNVLGFEVRLFGTWWQLPF